MVELITDRTQYHVALLNKLRRKPWSSMTSSEKSAWYKDAAKGAYNYTDLNRVETAVTELARRLGLTLTTKTNWTLWDVPTTNDMERYLRNVQTIRDACPGDADFPDLPYSMSGLTYVGANNIEKTLMLVYQNIDTGDHKCVLGEFILGECTLGGKLPEVEDSIIRSGEIYCGEVV